MYAERIHGKNGLNVKHFENSRYQNNVMDGTLKVIRRE